MPVVHLLFKSHFFQCLHCYHCYVLYSHWAQEASLCYWELMLRSHLKASVSCAAIDLLSCTGMYRFLACFGSPGLSGKALLGGIKRPGALRSKQRVAWAPSRSQLQCSNKHQEMHTIVHTAACAPSHTRLTQLSPARRHNTVQPWLSFRHRACYRVIALLINVSPSQDNGLVFTVRFSRLAMTDIQWCNLLSVHYALHGSPWGTLFPGSSQVTHLSMHYFSLLPICFSLLHREIDPNHKRPTVIMLLWLQNGIFI